MVNILQRQLSSPNFMLVAIKEPRLHLRLQAVVVHCSREVIKSQGGDGGLQDRENRGGGRDRVHALWM